MDKGLKSALTFPVLIITLFAGCAGYFEWSGAADAAESFEELRQSLPFLGGAEPSSAELVIPPTVFVSRGPVRQSVIAPGRTVYGQTWILPAAASGRIAELPFRTGDPIPRGAVLLRLDHESLQQALAEAREALRQAQAAHDLSLARAEWEIRSRETKLHLAESEQQRRLAEAELVVQLAQARLDQARLQFPSLTAAQIRLANATAIEVEALAEYEEAVARRDALWEPPEVADNYLRILEAAKDARAIAGAELRRLRNNAAAQAEEVVALEIETQKAALALEWLAKEAHPLLVLELEAARQARDHLVAEGIDPSLGRAIQQAEADLAAATLVAPFDAMLLQVHVSIGEQVSRGESLFTIAALSDLEVIASVIEEDLPLLALDQPVQLFFDAFPNMNVTGRVSHISRQRLPASDRPLFDAAIQLDEIPQGLAAGMTADSTIIVEERANVLRLPRAAVKAGVGQRASLLVWLGDAAEMREVTLGMRGDIYIEITGGLREGEQVVER